MPEKYVQDLHSKFGQGQYRYKKSQKGRANFKVRIYSVIIYYLFKNIKIKEPIELSICRDFNGKETEIESNLRYFLEQKLKYKIDSMKFTRLGKDSTAHEYSYLMRKDTKNKMTTYVEIKLSNIEKFLRK